jgi:hypothetical protein
MSKSIIKKEEEIVSRIYFIRGHKVMLDFDLAEMYEVETRALKQQVRRNTESFPDDFMFILSDEEVDILVSQFVIPSKSYFGGAMPMAFTEQGVAMLSSVLKSKKARQVNIAIIRTFVQLRKLIDTNKDLAHKIETLEKKYDQQFKVVFDAIKQLIHQKNQPLPKVGYKK